MRVLASSSTYETEPVGEILDQPDFLNACLRIETALEPEALLDACKAVERELGRERRAARATGRGRSTSTCCCSATSSYALRAAARSRTREVTSRRFVLIPLLELDPELTTPDGARARRRARRARPGRRGSAPGRRCV